jgi:hypothetical protein
VTPMRPSLSLRPGNKSRGPAEAGPHAQPPKCLGEYIKHTRAAALKAAQCQRVAATFTVGPCQPRGPYPYLQPGSAAMYTLASRQIVNVLGRLGGRPEI